MAKKTVTEIDVTGKRVLVRVDFNVPQPRMALLPMIRASGLAYRP